MIWSVTVFADDDPIRALEFQFKDRDDAINFVGFVFESAKDNVAVSIMKKEESPKVSIYDARTGERKEYDV